MRALVTGGGGFLGLAIVRQLAQRGDEVLSFSRGSYPALDALGVPQHAVDLSNRAATEAAFAEAAREAPLDCVFHVAAKAGYWGEPETFHAANVLGTRHVIAGCERHGVPRLVHTSSPSVCFDGRDHLNASNDLPRASSFLSPYPESKARAEAEVLEASGRGNLTTCALRPHLIFGPGDPHLIPRVIERARSGRLRIVGKGENEVSLTFVENAAHAHLCAADRLTPIAPHAGRAYFLGQAEPVKLWPWINALLERVQVAPVTRKVPFRLAYAAGATLEGLWRTLRLAGEPPMTRFVAAQLATSHSYSLEPAERDFGYREQVPLDEATERTIASLG